MIYMNLSGRRGQLQVYFLYPSLPSLIPQLLSINDPVTLIGRRAYKLPPRRPKPNVPLVWRAVGLYDLLLLVALTRWANYDPNTHERPTDQDLC